MDKVSIIIPFYNCEYVDQAIESALNQTYSNIEVIVVNDGSTKFTEKIEPYKEKIKLIEKPNGGTASALNTGIQNATGEYIAWLSSDDIFYPNKTADQLAFMHNRNADISYGGFVLINGEGKITRPFMPSTGVSKRLVFLKVMKRQCLINGCTVMAKKEVFNRCGLFDESLFYVQDYDMWLRIVQHYHFHFLNKPIIQYRIHPNMGTIQHKKELLMEETQIRKKYRNTLKQMIDLEKKRSLFPQKGE
ncbi:glycosyl transferase family 2 [Pueribacillus theae]|uniref:Glycosyl transferase family 2 n=1 Tax=Pueribacillus theae TaxID=2171751 RepID=A0A2U1K5C3_9BACI|nr:glycosyltransferase [Pueribacillus theae]PWA12716.1 glycosyl transferase family 2 [Pueribacillus theae]